MNSNVLSLHFATSQVSSSQNSNVDDMLEGYKIKSALPFNIFSTLHIHGMKFFLKEHLYFHLQHIITDNFKKKLCIITYKYPNWKKNVKIPYSKKISTRCEILRNNCNIVFRCSTYEVGLSASSSKRLQILKNAK